MDRGGSGTGSEAGGVEGRVRTEVSMGARVKGLPRRQDQQQHHAMAARGVFASLQAIACSRAYLVCSRKQRERERKTELLLAQSCNRAQQIRDVAGKTCRPAWANAYHTRIIVIWKAKLWGLVDATLCQSLHARTLNDAQQCFADIQQYIAVT